MVFWDIVGQADNLTICGLKEGGFVADGRWAWERWQAHVGWWQLRTSMVQLGRECLWLGWSKASGGRGSVGGLGQALEYSWPDGVPGRLASLVVLVDEFSEAIFDEIPASFEASLFGLDIGVGKVSSHSHKRHSCHEQRRRHCYLPPRLRRWYTISKTLAEQAAWKFSKENGMDLVTIHPGFVIGPLLQPSNKTSANLLLNQINGMLLMHIFKHLKLFQLVEDTV
ncbi:uncharacterized protein LOC133830898 [Humulus lupulus]|uniref:uncharacterized protein LOC133830898 n=1 Tax=Humulus lupulus TaxID=3486 RepID=UPI002B408472|nr:uncharacterized protein LOC133830898 [Humulus lupulus]